MTAQQQLQHLYWRAGFGPRPQDVAAGLSPGQALRRLLHAARAYEPIPSSSLAAFQDPRRARYWPWCPARRGRPPHRPRPPARLSRAPPTRPAPTPHQRLSQF
ncbi:MAG: hypothetical protein WKG07_45300 [Hymenobacter sp.]